MFRVFVQRSASAITDLGFAMVTFSTLKWLVDAVFTFGVAFAAVKLGDVLASRLGWFRWELPSEGILGVAWAFAVYFPITTFVGYWQHRLMHWRWFWHLHRFHHSATDFNLLTGFRANPGEAISNLLPALSPIVLLKVPDAGLFASFVFVNLVLGQLQHSELPWADGLLHRRKCTRSIIRSTRSIATRISLWDQLFGTWYGGPNRPSAYGIPDRAHVERPATQWLIDVWIFYRDVARSLAGWARTTRAGITRTQPVSQAADTPASILLSRR